MVLGIRIDEELAERLDEAAERLSKALGGERIDRSKIARVAMTRGLEVLEGEAKKRK